ncbi:hypothetical protein JXI42_03630 [bacterium]|nr:hypothetical protein [bacterium]
MKIIYRLFLVLSIVFLFGLAESAPERLDLLGQVSGGAGFTVEYKDGRLYAGCGSSILVFDATDPAEEIILARRDFLSIMTRIIVRDDTLLFVGVNHDGIYALDGTEPDLPILAYTPMPDHDHWVADFELTPPDTLWLSDMKGLRKLHFNGSSFIELESYFEGRKVAGIAIRDTFMAVCTREIFSGHVELYSIAQGRMEPIYIFNDPRLTLVQDVQFADLRDDIIYVLGGSPNIGVNGDFIALQFDSDSLFEVARHTFSGIPIYAQTCVMNMDSRNDTLFLATMAGMYWPPAPDTSWIDCPVLDGTLLPDTLPIIAHIIPGLWYFDVALHDELPALAIGSEWLGIYWADISDLSARFDTIAFHRTGGWGHKSLLRGDTLWLAWRGGGVGIFDVSDPTRPIQLEVILGQFATDVAILDSIVCVARGSQFRFHNLAPWHRGFEIEKIDSFWPPRVLFENHTCYSVITMETDVGARFLCGTTESGLDLIDPLDLPDVESRGLLFENQDPLAMECSGDTLFMVTSETLFVAIISHDSANVLTRYPVPGPAYGLCREGEFVAVMCQTAGAYWFNFTGDSLILLGTWDPVREARMVEYRDSLLYAPCSSEGLYILDIWHSPEPETLAWFPGTGGWEFLDFGTSHVTFNEEGMIFLTDFHGGCFILEAYDRHSLIGEIGEIKPDNFQVSCYPNPFNSSVKIAIVGVLNLSLEALAKGDLTPLQADIYDINGRLIYSDRQDLADRQGCLGDRQGCLGDRQGCLSDRQGCLSIHCKDAYPDRGVGKGGTPIPVNPPTHILSYNWQPDESVPSGIYLVRVRFMNNTVTKKAVYLK